MKPLQRPNWDEYFMEIAEVTKKRTNCIRNAVGAVVVRDKTIIGTGYNGTPAGIKNCFEGGCDRCTRRENNKIGSGEEKDKCICIHAEQNAILQSAYHGIPTKGASLYSTIAPCVQCAKMIINAGITEVVALDEHSDNFGEELLKKAGITIRFIENPIKKEE